MPELSRESDFHTIASEAQYFSAPLGKVWFSQGQLGYLQIRIIKNITVFLMPGEHAPLHWKDPLHLRGDKGLLELVNARKCGRENQVAAGLYFSLRPNSCFMHGETKDQ